MKISAGKNAEAIINDDVRKALYESMRNTVFEEDTNTFADVDNTLTEEEDLKVRG